MWPRARGGHGRRGPTALQRGGDGHKLSRRVRPVRDDHLPRWQGPQAHGSRWSEGLEPWTAMLRPWRSGREGVMTSDSFLPMVTVRARPGLPLSDAVRTQHGPASGLAPSRLDPRVTTFLDEDRAEVGRCAAQDLMRTSLEDDVALG